MVSAPPGVADQEAYYIGNGRHSHRPVCLSTTFLGCKGFGALAVKVQVSRVFLVSWKLKSVSPPSPIFAAGLVRMAHASRSSLFQQRLQNALQVLTQQAQRIPVLVLPASTRAAIQSNRHKLSLCSGDLSEEDFEDTLSLLNGEWSEPLEGGLVHYCATGCCLDEDTFRKRLRDCLQVLFGRGFSVPLLYRWKHWEPASWYTTRGLLVHGLLPVLWKMARLETADSVDELAALDPDSADMSPALVQQIRSAKVERMLCDPGATDPYLPSN